MPNENIPDNINLPPVSRPTTNVNQSRYNIIPKIMGFIYLVLTVVFTTGYVAILYEISIDTCLVCGMDSYAALYFLGIIFIIVVLAVATLYGYLKTANKNMGYLTTYIIIIIISFFLVSCISYFYHELSL